LQADGGTCLWQNSISTRNIVLRIRVSGSPEGEIGKPGFTGPTQTPVATVNDQAAIDLGSLGILLIEMFNRIQTIDPRDAHSIEVLNYIDANLSKLESLPALPQSVRNSIHGCRLTYDEIRREVALRNRELGH
jgi:hypothetical protein